MAWPISQHFIGGSFLTTHGLLFYLLNALYIDDLVVNSEVVNPEYSEYI